MLLCLPVSVWLSLVGQEHEWQTGGDVAFPDSTEDITPQLRVLLKQMDFGGRGGICTGNLLERRNSL